MNGEKINYSDTKDNYNTETPSTTLDGVDPYAEKERADKKMMTETYYCPHCGEDGCFSSDNYCADCGGQLGEVF